MARAGALIVMLFLAGCLAPGDAEIAEGNRLAAAGKLDEAAERFRAAAASSARARPRELLGAVLHAAGKNDDARKAWLEAVQLEPEASAEAQLGLSRIDSENGDQTAALDRLGRLLERNPRRPDARLVRAVVYLRRNADGDVERALDDSDLALRALPQSADAMYARGNALLAAHKVEEARAQFERMPKGCDAAWGQARVAAAQSRHADVILHLREARAAADGGWVAQRVREDAAFRYLWDDPDFSREF
jgi:tetratricopeptide (TPR) repeat protein